MAYGRPSFPTRRTRAAAGSPSASEIRRLRAAWRRISLVILVGNDLRAAFPGGDTLSLDRPGPAIALVQVTDELAFRFTSLRRTIRAVLGTDARLLRLPARPEDAERLLDELAH